jgi:hypothetical protein
MQSGFPQNPFRLIQNKGDWKGGRIAGKAAGHSGVESAIRLGGINRDCARRVDGSESLEIIAIIQHLTATHNCIII